MNIKNMLFNELRRQNFRRNDLLTSKKLLHFKNSLSPVEAEQLPKALQELCDNGFFKADGGYRLTDKGYEILWKS